MVNPSLLSLGSCFPSTSPSIYIHSPLLPPQFPFASSLPSLLHLHILCCHLCLFVASTRPIIMSCNGCRVLRKGCSESCILRPCLQWIGTPEAQGHATVFVAKFFGRAGLMSFISGVAEDQRPALFQSLLFEACGRTVNPVNGAVGLLGSGNWSVCQAAVETVLRGGVLTPEATDASQVLLLGSTRNKETQTQDALRIKRRRADTPIETSDLDLSLSSGCLRSPVKKRSDPVAVYSEEESSMTSMESGCGGYTYSRGSPEKRVLNLFV